MASAFVDDPCNRSFERLYDRYGREVYRYVLAVLRNPAEAEDVTQTTFLNAYRAMRAGELPEKPHNWLIAIAHNACRSRVRFAMRRPKEIPLDDVVEQLTVPEQERTNIRELLRALGRLPFNQRAALTMRELEGRSYPEIADTLGVTVPAVEALLSRARKALRLQAAALRGLVVVQIPRSLRRLFENGDAATGAVGAKTAAIIAAGVVAGGVGVTVRGDAARPSAPSPAVPAVALVTHGVPAADARHRATAPARRRHAAAAVRKAPRATAAHGPARSATTNSADARPAASAPVERTAAKPAAPAPSAPAASAPAAAPTAPAAAAPQTVAATVTDTVQQATAALPVSVPTVPVPPVQVPELPPPPAPPTPPAPSLPPAPLP